MKSDQLEGRILGGRWLVGELAARGGMSSVYRGRDEQEGTPVAVKVLRLGLKPELRSADRFRREARAASRLDHPNVVSIRAHGEIDTGQRYLILDYIDGVGLHQIIHKQAPLGIRRALHVTAQIAEGLAHAHQNGVLHRDLKPGNVQLIHQRGEADVVKILDFGLAKIIDLEETDTITRAGLVFGTPEYMAPEQAVGQKVDARCDIYALGTILFEMLTGKPPFKGKGVFETLRMQVGATPPRPSEARQDIQVPPIVERIIMRCLEKQPENRFTSAVQLARALRAVGRQLSSSRKESVSSGITDSQTPTMGGDRAILLDPDEAAQAEYLQLRRHRQETLRRAADLLARHPVAPRMRSLIESIAVQEQLAVDRGAELAVANSAMEESRAEALALISQLRVANIYLKMEATRLRELREEGGRSPALDQQLEVVAQEIQGLERSLRQAELDLARQKETADTRRLGFVQRVQEVEKVIDHCFDDLAGVIRAIAGSHPGGELGQLLEDLDSFDRWIAAHEAIVGEKQ